MGRLDALEPRERLLSPPRPPSCPQPDAVRGIAREQAHGTGRVRLTGLTGVQPTDRLDDDELTSRFCRDCPRLTVKPVHALIVVLLLCCALSTSLTLLVRQSLHYAAYREQQYDRLAAVIRESFDMAAVYEMMGIDGNRMTDSRKEDSE